MSSTSTLDPPLPMGGDARLATCSAASLIETTFGREVRYCRNVTNALPMRMSEASNACFLAPSSRLSSNAMYTPIPEKTVDDANKHAMMMGFSGPPLAFCESMKALGSQCRTLISNDVSPSPLGGVLAMSVTWRRVRNSTPLSAAFSHNAIANS